MDTAKSSLTEIVEQLKRANTAYRVGKPIMTDSEYDDALDFLETRMDVDTFAAFRKTLTEVAGDVAHRYKMGSLGKIKAFDGKFSIKDWIQKNIPDTGDGLDGIFVSSKIDGCSACLQYVNGELVSAATRGDGTTGVDILHKAALFVPTKIASTFNGFIRGEITLTHETFGALCEYTGKAYKNLRNTTAGLINSVSSGDEEISFLRFFAYEIMGPTGMTKLEQFKKLKELGFNTAIYDKFTALYEGSLLEDDTGYDSALLAVFNRFQESAPFDMDGLVVSDLNDNAVFEDEFIPSRTVAVKFNQMTAETQLVDISWALSKNGTLHPVGIVDTVELGGANVSNVTLNNLRMIADMGLKYGCTVSILKSGDIIPKIVGVSHPHPEMETEIDFPKYCPSCGSELVYEENALFPKCANGECDDVLANRTEHMLRQLKIKNLSTKTIKKFGLYHVEDLIKFKSDGSAVATKFEKDLNEKMFGAPREELLAAFDYDGVSTSIIEKMVAHYGFEKLTTYTLDDFVNGAKPYGVGDKFIEKFYWGFQKYKDAFNAIIGDSRYFGDRPKAAKAPKTTLLNGNGFVVTGDLDTMSRNEFKQKVVTNGGVYQSGVSKKTSYLVTNETTRTTKLCKAEALGVRIINEREFLDMLENSDGLSLF